MPDFETGINLLRVAQAVDEQAGAHQCDQRKRHLDHHQNAAQTVPSRAPGGGVRAITQGGKAVFAGRLQGGHEPKEQRGQQGETQGKQ